MVFKSTKINNNKLKQVREYFPYSLDFIVLIISEAVDYHNKMSIAVGKETSGHSPQALIHT